MKPSFLWRIRAVSALIIIFGLFLVARLYFLQIVSREDFVIKADKQYTQTVSTIFDRGSIYFQNEDGSLSSAAVLKDGYDIVINPQKITDPQKTYDALVALIPTLDQTTFMTDAAKQSETYEDVAQKIDDDTGAKVAALNLPGVSAAKQQWRYYPQGGLAAQTLGFVGYQGNTLAGRYGIESSYDSVLERTDNSAYVNFFAQLFSNVTAGSSTPSESQEGDVVTTIEPTVQKQLEDELAGVQKQYQSGVTGGIVINPKNGEIYAMGATPSFDPNDFQDVSDPSVYTNPMVENVYEMGSIIKSLTMAAGIDSGTVTATTTYDDKGYITLDGSTIWNYDLQGRGPTTSMQTVLDDSLNTGASFVALKMGDDLFTKYMLAYGLGEKTGIDLPNEAQDLVANLQSPRELEHATASFGQGIALTPIATVRALSVIANGGYLITPHVVKQINYQDGVTKVLSYPPGPQVIKQSSSQAITAMLIQVVDTALLGGTVKMANYSIAAKTGTAQIASPNGGYYADRYLDSFFGYFPATNPQFLIFLFTYNPQGVEFASESLTQPFIDLAKLLINYYKVPPDR